MTTIIIFFLAHWYLSLFGQTFFYHRYGAHSMFTMSRTWEKFFFIFSWLTQGSSYLNPRAYGIMHRMHHAYSDTAKDPHSPHFFENIFTMMWGTKKIYHALLKGTYRVEEKFEKNLPVWPALERMADSWYSRLAFAFVYIIFYGIFATEWWLFFLLPFHFLIGPVHGAIVNWGGHKYGYRNWKEKDHSTNTLPVDFLMGGELFQNNHHHASNRANFANKWWEIDPSYPIILFLNKIGVIRLRI